MGIERTPEPGILPGLQLRRGPAKNQLLSCRGRPGSIPGSGCEVQDGRVRVAAREFDLKCEVEWVHGNWMSRQRCAGRLGKTGNLRLRIPRFDQSSVSFPRSLLYLQYLPFSEINGW